MDLVLGILYGITAQAVTFVQLQGQFKFIWAKDHPFLMACMGIPISMLYLGSVKHMVPYFDGQLWPSRLIGFAVGAIVFTVMSIIWFKEPLSTKTLVCLSLAVSIMCIQLFWK